MYVMVLVCRTWEQLFWVELSQEWFRKEAHWWWCQTRYVWCSLISGSRHNGFDMTAVVGGSSFCSVRWYWCSTSIMWKDSEGEAKRRGRRGKETVLFIALLWKNRLDNQCSSRGTHSWNCIIPSHLHESIFTDTVVDYGVDVGASAVCGCMSRELIRG